MTVAAKIELSPTRMFPYVSSCVLPIQQTYCYVTTSHPSESKAPSAATTKTSKNPRCSWFLMGSVYQRYSQIIVYRKPSYKPRPRMTIRGKHSWVIVGNESLLPCINNFKTSLITVHSNRAIWVNQPLTITVNWALTTITYYNYNH